MPRTVKEIIQAFCVSNGLPSPASIASSNDIAVKQLLGLMNDFLDDLIVYKAHQANIREAVWTVTSAVEDQGDIDTLADKGFVEILPDTFFNRSKNLKVIYGLTPEEWQARKAVGTIAGPSYWCRQRNGRLLFSPPPAVGEILAFEYRSNFFVEEQTPSTGVYKARLTKDDDLLTVPDYLGKAYLEWKWRSKKGLDYAEEQRAYEELRTTYLMRDNGPRKVDMGADRHSPSAGVIIPIGNWPL